MSEEFKEIKEVISYKELKESMPQHIRKNITEDLTDKINLILVDDEERDAFKSNILGLSSVLKEGKFKIESYVNAVRYVSFILMKNTNQASYALTFPDKVREWDAQGKTATQISSSVAIYNKSKLVNLVREAALIPAHIYNADKFQEAINVAAGIMNDKDVSPKVRVDAANTLLTHLKRPEKQTVELDIGINEGSAIADLRATTAALSAQQREMIASNIVNAKDIAEQDIVIKKTTEEE